MANYANLKATIAANIKQNGNEEITGPILQSVLTQMTTLLGSGWAYAGVATPATAPGTPDNNVFYITSTAGTYTNFGGLVVAENEVAILKYNGAWAKDVPGIATAAQVTQLGQEVTELDVEVNGGDEVLGKKILEVDNERVNANNMIFPLLAPARSFRMKLSVPDGTNITKYSIYVYESDNTSHYYGDFTPGIEQVFTDKGYDIVKVAVAALTPNERYTGTFVFEVVKYKESLLARKEEVSQLSQQVDGLEHKVEELDAEVFGGTFSPELTWSDGYVQGYTGEIKASTSLKYTQPFLLKKGQKVTIGTNDQNIGIICTTDANSLSIGDTVTILQRTSGSVGFETYTYVAEQDIKIVLCVKWSDYSLSFSVDNGLMGKVRLLEMNDESSKAEFEGLESMVNNLKAEVDGGDKLYANKPFDINNQFINYTTLYVELEEPLSDFYYKFITPEGVAITSFGVRVWDEEGNVYQYEASVSPNEEGHFWTSLGYKVKKFAINTVTPNVRYTGTFKIQIYKKIVFDGLELQVKGGDVAIGKKIVEADNEFVNSNNMACSLLDSVRSFRMKLSVPDGVSITKYSIYVIESDNTSHYFGDFTPGIEQVFTDKGYDIVKVAVASLTPNARYTGTFVFEVVKYYESPLARKEDVATQIAEINSKINYDDRETIPAYYFANDYLPNKISFIRNLLEGCSVNGDVFIFQTDEHWERNAQRSPALIKYIADNLNVCRLFDGGDSTQVISSNGHTSNWVMDFEKLRKKTFNGRLHHIVGNHEYLTEAYSDLALYDDADFYDWVDYCYFNNRDTDIIVYGDPEKHYYYVDNKQRKIRYIILSSFKQKITPIENVGGTYTRVAEDDMDATQLNWFTNTALNVEQGWTILVFNHFFCSVNRDGRTDDGYMLNVSPYIWGAAIPFARAMLNYNGNGTIAAVIQGHMHWDAAFTIDDNIAGNPTPTGRQIPCIATACDAYNFSGMPSEVLFNRTINTITEQAFDVVVLNKTARKLTFVRIGAPAYNLLVPDATGNYPMFGNLEYREFTY